MTTDTTVSPSAAAGAAIYNQFVLTVYDYWVLGFSNRLAWQCPAHESVAFYNRYVSAHHLDVGVGTGYFLDHCHFPIAQPSITLLDLNPNSLQVTTTRLHRYQPAPCVANVLQPLPLIKQFDSIGLGYVLHCLPGTMLDKSLVFTHLKPLLTPQGVLFGTTILGEGVPHNKLGLTLMKIYNNKGIFSNYHDNEAALRQILQANFRRFDLTIKGCVAFFVAYP